MPGEYDYAEGGGRLPPYKESFLENIVNVSWQGTGGVFVSGDFCCYQRYTRLENNKSDRFRWLALHSLAFGDGGGTESSSYGKTVNGPVFLLGGHGGIHGHSGGVLMTSNDGYRWIEQIAGWYFDNISGLVWDVNEKRFYATDGSSTCIYSSDGIHWAVSGTAFEEHCRNPLGAPDGFYGYDKSNDMVIYPKHGEAIVITNASTMDAEEFPINVGMSQVNAINFTGGIWMAGGGRSGGDLTYVSITTTSLDGGNHWFYTTAGDLGMTGDFQITTLIGAPIQDFRGAYAPKGKLPPVDFSGTRPQVPTTTAVFGAQNASQPQRPQHGVVATAISPPRRFRPRIRGAKW